MKFVPIDSTRPISYDVQAKKLPKSDPAPNDKAMTEFQAMLLKTIFLKPLVNPETKFDDKENDDEEGEQGILETDKSAYDNLLLEQLANKLAAENLFGFKKNNDQRK